MHAHCMTLALNCNKIQKRTWSSLLANQKLARLSDYWTVKLKNLLCICAGNSCTKLGQNAPAYMQPVQVGGLLQLITTRVQPPAEAPFPVLNVSDVVEPPLPTAVKPLTPSLPVGGGGNASPPASQPSEGPQFTIPSVLATLSALFGLLLLI